MSCDYTDIIMPIDYIPEAFEYANRKLFHKWKMIGMQVSHGTVGDITPPNFILTLNTKEASISEDGTLLDSSVINTEKRIGALSGCLPIEEINQNNHIIGRGAYYFRHKSTAESNTSATYGIQGHCNSPGIEWGRGDSLGLRSANGYFNPSMIEDITASPMYRGWGKRLGPEFCTCGYSNYWHMAVFLEDKDTGRVTMHYQPNDENYKGTDYVCHNSRFGGRFNACFGDTGHVFGGYRSCEATLEALVNDFAQSGPCKIDFDSFKSEIGDDGRPINNTASAAIGVLVKLTSLPACDPFKNNFFYNQPIQEIPKDDGSKDYSYFRFPCERAVIRISSYCTAGVGWGPESTVMGGTNKFFHSETIERHYDRWDPAEEGGLFPETRYKIFDEVYDVPGIPYRVRVLSNHSREINNYFKCYQYSDCLPGYTDFMQVKYLTGGSSTGVPGQARGCSCSHDGQDIEHYPIRPYNSFNYCPNNFTCEKSCT